MSARRDIRFSDPRTPHEIRCGLEREWMTPFVARLENGLLSYHATILQTGVRYRLRLTFEAAPAKTHIYTLHLEAATGPFFKDPAGWFDIWTRGLVPAGRPRRADMTSERYRSLCDAALHAEDHLADVPSVQREILREMRAGTTFSHSYKEGGTTISWTDGKYVISDYGNWESLEEFTDEEKFLEALWSRLDSRATHYAGPDQADPLTAWKLALRLLRYHPCFPPPPIHPPRHPFSLVPKVFAALALACAAVLAAKALTVRSVGAPWGASVRAGDAVATLVTTQEPYFPSLHRNPDRDRFRIDVLLSPLDGGKSPRTVNLARELDRGIFHPTTRILGVDGPMLWMQAPELKGLHLKTLRVTGETELLAAAPELDAIWHTAKPYFNGRLHIVSADRQRSFTIDPDSLRAVPDDTAPRVYGIEHEPTAESMSCLGGRISEKEFLAVLSPKERAADFKPGSTIPKDLAAERTREPRQLHHVKFAPAGARLRIQSVEALSAEAFDDAAFVRNSAGANPIALRDPAGFLMTFREGSILAPKVALARIDAAGLLVWKIDTGLSEITQILPDAAHLVLVGKQPAPEGKIPPPVLFIVNTATGSAITRPLRP